MQIARAIENIICFCILHKKSRKQGYSTAALSASSHTKPKPVLDETESRDSFEANPSETQHGGLFLCCKDLARSMAAVMASMKQPLFSVTRRGQHLGYCSFLQQCPCASLSYSLTGSEEHPSLCRRFEVLKMQDRPPLAQRLCRHRSTFGAPECLSTKTTWCRTIFHFFSNFSQLLPHNIVAQLAPAGKN